MQIKTINFNQNRFNNPISFGKNKPPESKDNDSANSDIKLTLIHKLPYCPFTPEKKARMIILELNKKINKIKADTLQEFKKTTDNMEKAKKTQAALKQIRDNFEKARKRLNPDINHDFLNYILLKLNPISLKRYLNGKKPIPDDFDKKGKSYFDKILHAQKEYAQFLAENKFFDKNLDVKQLFNTAKKFASEMAEDKENNLTIKYEGLKTFENKKLVLGNKKPMESRNLYYIFSNLLQNSVKYTPDGGKITIKFYKDKYPQEFKFSIEDNGMGIPPEAQEKVLNGKRADNAIKSGISGSGFGLIQIKTLIKAAGGNILIESPLNKNDKKRPGTKITVEIPIKETKNAG